MVIRNKIFHASLRARVTKYCSVATGKPEAIFVLLIQCANAEELRELSDYSGFLKKSVEYIVLEPLHQRGIELSEVDFLLRWDRTGCHSHVEIPALQEFLGGPDSFLLSPGGGGIPGLLQALISGNGVKIDSFGLVN